jgi:thiol-disulfide isomerase/thioredoxin
MVTEITMDDLVKGLPTPDNDLRIVMFYGSTCGPCKATMPNYESAASFFLSKGARIQCFKLNAWEPADQADYCKNILGINGVPHFKVFCRGEQILEKAGGGDDHAMKKFLQSAVEEAFKRYGERI